MEYPKIFSAKCGNRNHIEAKVAVLNGKICWVSEETNHYNHGIRSYYKIGSDDENFDHCVSSNIKTLFKYGSRSEFEALVESLDQETLDKYFKKSYIPK